MHTRVRETLSGLGAAAITLAACSPAVHFTKRIVTEAESSAAVEIRERLPVTAARVAGHPVELVLDLGASQALTLSPDQIQELGATPTGETVRYTDAMGHFLQARVYRVPELQWAGIRWYQVRVIEQIWHPDFAPPVQLPILGRRLLGDLRVELDFAKGRVSIAPSRPGCERGSTVDGFADGILFGVEVQGRSLTALIDTAATHNVALDPSLAGSRSLRIGPFEAGEIELVGHAMPGIPADILLGVPFLMNHGVTVDFGAGCLEMKSSRSDRTRSGIQDK